jgi:hypothetical protein
MSNHSWTLILERTQKYAMGPEVDINADLGIIYHNDLAKAALHVFWFGLSYLHVNRPFTGQELGILSNYIYVFMSTILLGPVLPQ